jgi:hypothetical protein
MSVAPKWLQTLRDPQPKVIVAFGYGAELAPLCALARGVDPSVFIYTIEPRRECFVNPARSGAEVSPDPIFGLRAVVEATFQVGGGCSTRIRAIKREWEAACHRDPLRRWAYRNALCGHDTAYILVAALERALGRRFVSRRTLPQAIVEPMKTLCYRMGFSPRTVNFSLRYAAFILRRIGSSKISGRPSLK